MARHPNNKFTPERGEEVCRLIAVEGLPTRQIAARLGINYDTLFAWLHRETGFFEKYQLARRVACWRLAEEAIELSDDDSRDRIASENGAGRAIMIPDHAAVQRAKLQVDTRKWLISKLMPETFGDLVRHAGPDAGPLQVEHVTPEERRRRAREEIDAAFPERQPGYEPPPQPPVPKNSDLQTTEERQRCAREEIDAAFPERAPDGPPGIPREYAAEGPLEGAPDVARLPTRYRPMRILGEWSG